MSCIQIIMYHYVRPIRNSRYPNIKGLELEGFKRQLDYLSSRYHFITAEDVVESTLNDKVLPKDACWLTFDDGYKDHIQHVLPELEKRKIQGSFFPPVKPVKERVMLDVNSIHYILASCSNINELVNDLNRECCYHGLTENDLQKLWSDHAVASRFDIKEVIYIKRLLQHALPELMRHEIVSKLFRKYMNIDQTDFAEVLYMSELDVKELINSGMYVGSHGYQHLWLNKVDEIQQKDEIDKSLDFLHSVGARTKNWIMCYPYGAYDTHTIRALEKSHCAVGITTEVAKADLKTHHRLKLPRFDTNDFPQ